MSGRGRGGGGGGRGQPVPSQSSGGGRGGDGGKGRGVSSVGYTAVPSQAASMQSNVSNVASTSLSRAVENMSLGAQSSSPSPFQSVSTVQQPVQAPACQAQGQSPHAGALPASRKSIRFPNRPGYGTLGARCSVRANHFLVEVADNDLHHYNISISPEITSKQICRDIVNKLCKLYRESHLGKRQLAYDGSKSVFTAGKLPFVSKDFVVKLDNEDHSRKEREFKITIKLAAEVSLDHLRQFLAGRQHDVPQETIQALDVVLRAAPSNKYQVVGRSLFDPKFEYGPLENGLLYWKGFYQSLRPTQMGISLNIDMSASAFFEPLLVSEFVSKYFDKDLSKPLSDQDRIKVKKVLRGLRVEMNDTENSRKYKIQSLSSKPICELKFPLGTGEEKSVMQFYREKYNVAIMYKFLPALNAGTDAKPTYLPMEIYRIVEGQRYSKKLTDRQVTAMLRATCQRPKEREDVIKKIVAVNNYNKDAVVEDFGIRVGKDHVVIDARVLPPPMLKYGDQRVSPRVGQWNMIDKRMEKGGEIDYWTFVNFSRNSRPQMIDKFCQELVAMCASRGMDFNSPPICPVYSADSRIIEKTLTQVKAQCEMEMKRRGLPADSRLKLLIVILPEVSGSYGRIKRVCETELDIVSQCCQPKHVTRLNKQYLENVSLKINVKAGGRNTVLQNAVDRRIPLVTDRPTIIMGADVSHPSPGEDSSASIAAVVASMDWPEVTKYKALVSSQNHREEIIQDLYKKEATQNGVVHKGMIRELLISFRRSTGQKPHRIIFYRDGVSDGQFNHVLLYEMDAIRKACCSLEENYLPPVTFVVVQKRHHTRLFPTNHGDRNSTDKSGNILPGTVVDRTICHPTEFDFYLCSHSGIQGTSRPAHYHVLYDENQFSADALQMLTYSLCYTFARCTRSVSIVPPAYYAHLAASRARCYNEGRDSEIDSSSGGGKTTREKENVVKPLPVIKDHVKEVMFYC